MSSTKCERFNWLLVVLGVAVAISFLALPIERLTLYIYFIVVSQLIWGGELCGKRGGGYSFVLNAK